MNNFQKLALDDTFRFFCHPGIECFNRCCADLNQFLTPYDILRLKNGLKLSSGEFLKRYTTHHIGPGSGLPVVTLKMLEHENLSCPFLSKAGCTVYPDRPGSCRIYPLARIVQRRPNQHTCEEFHIVIKEPHCLGFKESKEWTVRAWKKNQAVNLYDEMNDLLMDIISLKNRSGRKRLTHKQNELFYLACYDLDRFRDLLFEPQKRVLTPQLAAGLASESENGKLPYGRRFPAACCRDLQKRLWEARPVEQEVVKALEEDDVALMRFGIEWIKSAIFGDRKDIKHNHESTYCSQGASRKRRKHEKGED